MPSGVESTRTLAAIMFADIVGYTAMMQDDEQQARKLRDRYCEVIKQCIPEHGGEIVQFYGDGALSIFQSAKEAVLSAARIQKALQEAPLVPVRIGVHLGDIMRDDAGVYGDCVNLASRVESLGIPGSVLFSDKVFSELENHPAIRSLSLGTYQFKNVRRPIEVYALNDPAIVVPGREQLDAGKLKSPDKSVAVLPFDNMSGSDESDYFAQGVSAEIANGLTKVDGIATISRTTCEAIKSNREDLSSIRTRLNISHILEGSVRTAGNRVRVSVQLVSTADGFQVWSDVIDKTLDDIFGVQDEIAHQVVQGLRVNFQAPSAYNQIVQPKTKDSAAYKLYLKSLHHLDKNIPDESKKAVELLEEALQMDPGFSAARCALSNCYSFLGSCGVINPIDAFNKAHRFALQAIEQSPNLAEAHLAMAILKFYHFWDWESARTSLEKARELGLKSALLHQTYGLYYAATGDHALGVVELRQNLELDPLSLPVMNMLGTLYLFNEQYDDAIDLFGEILDLDPAFRSAMQAKGVALTCLGRLEEALEVFTEYHRLVNHPDKGLIGLVIVNHHLGNNDQVDDYLQRLHKRHEREGSAAVEVDLGIIYCGLRQYSRGFEFLNSVYDKRFSIACMGMIWIVRCPLFKDLWNRPDYLDLLKRMELEPLPA